MENDPFEKQAADKLSGLVISPADQVWERVDKRLNRQERKRKLIFWLLPLSLLMSAIILKEFNAEDNPITHQLPVELTEEIAKVPENGESVRKKEEAIAGSMSDNSHLHQPTGMETVKRGFEKKSGPFKAPTYDTHSKELNMATDIPQQNTNPDDYASTTDKNELIDFIPSAPLSLDNKPAQLPTAAKPLSKLDTIVVVAYIPVTTQTKNLPYWNFNAAYSFHGTGDLEGAQLEWGFEKNINRYFSLYNNIGVSLHGGSVIRIQPTNTISTPGTILPVGNGSVYELSTGIQTAPTIQTKIPGTPIHIGIGGLLRYQFSTGGSGYNIRRNQNTTTFTIGTIGTGNYTGFSLGYRVNLGLELISTRKNKIQFQAGFQNDTRGDVITGLGLVWKHAKQ
ncbi:MAG: hypothetical protein RLY85_31 [Bacteroidota bacterium]|jgi:hypothetical protein